MFRNTALVVAIAAATLSMPAHAQFGKLKDLAGGATGSSSSSASAAAPDEAAQEALVRRFVSSQSHSLQAQTSFARAFGLAEQVQLLEAERQALSSGSVNVDAMKKSVSVSEAAQAAIDERQAEGAGEGGLRLQRVRLRADETTDQRFLRGFVRSGCAGAAAGGAGGGAGNVLQLAELGMGRHRQGSGRDGNDESGITDHGRFLWERRPRCGTWKDGSSAAMPSKLGTHQSR